MDTVETTDFSTSRDRDRSARVYLNRIMPGILLLVTLLTLIETLTGKLPVSLWAACGAFWGIHLTFVMLVRLGADAAKVAGVSFVVYGCVELVAMFYSPDPVGASASLTFFVFASAYFLTAWQTVTFSVVAAAAITASSHLDPTWGDTYFFPSTAFVAVVTGTLAAFIMSRSRRTEERLQDLAAEQHAARERLEQVDRARDRLIANVSHELRTPLTSTIGSIETLLRDDVQLDEASRERLMHVARDGGLRLLALVEDLLTIGATRPDSLELAAQPERLATLAHDAIVGIGAEGDREVRVDVIADPLVQVDRLRMLQVIGNLAVNAIRHGEGDVVIETSAGDGEAVLRVIDDGEGVDPLHVNELFLPFARFSTRPDSTGLGLAICRTIVEAHGGHIGYSRLNKPSRTCFTVRLPIDS
jgi:signal transduction histidine kinase